MTGRSRIMVALGVIAAVAGGAVAFAGGMGGTDDNSASQGAVPSTRVAFHEDAGVKNKRILNLGGLVVRASCIDYGQGRKYLSVGAKTTINDAARAEVLSQRRGGEAQTYSFRSSDFDRDFGWYDITGTNPYDKVRET